MHDPRTGLVQIGQSLRQFEHYLRLDAVLNPVLPLDVVIEGLVVSDVLGGDVNILEFVERQGH